ncbi:hypothetical protein JW992_08320 [candidate division KSB1 bacterium]|nr:hypothetical protein [candidate division KSB1 bacterium]
MTLSKITRILLFVLAGCCNQALAGPPTLYVVTRVTKNYHHPGIKNPAAGLFATRDSGKSWEHLGWPYGKFFSVSAHLLDNGDTLLCQACGNGVLISQDSGASWRISTGWEITECLKTAIHPHDPQILYTATAYGLYKSIDGGNSWAGCNHGLISTFTPTLIIDRENPEHLFCATEAGVHRSLDAGQSWEPIGLLGKGIRTLQQHPENSSILVAGTEDDGVFVSIDHGKSWQSASTGLKHLTVYALSFVPGKPETLYCGTYLGGVYRSRDLGRSWKPVNDGLTNLAIHALTTDPNNPETVYAGTLGDGVWRSSNEGDTWEFAGLETSEVWDFHWLLPETAENQF